MLRLAGQAPFRLRPLSSNVRRHRRRLCASHQSCSPHSHLSLPISHSRPTRVSINSHGLPAVGRANMVSQAPLSNGWLPQVAPCSVSAAQSSKARLSSLSSCNCGSWLMELSLSSLNLWVARQQCSERSSCATLKQCSRTPNTTSRNEFLTRVQRNRACWPPSKAFATERLAESSSPSRASAATQRPRVRGGEQCRLTLRSSRLAPAWHLARLLEWFIIHPAGQAPSRRSRLSSNVRRHRRSTR